MRPLSAWKARRPAVALHHWCGVFTFIYRACHLGQAKCWIFQILQREHPHIFQKSSEQEIAKGKLTNQLLFLL